LSYLNDPEYWRERAKETRAMAEHMTDLAVKRTMLTIADECTRKFCEEITAHLCEAEAKQRSKPVIEAAALPQSKLLLAAPTITGRIENAPGALSRSQKDDLPFRLRGMLRELNRNLGDELQSITGVKPARISRKD
jgi:hypothetical protein